MKPQVICLPGGVAPAAQRYAPLTELVGKEAELHLKDLEIYRDASPPPGYSVDIELAAIDQFADDLRLDTFHLLAYSGGGFISLAYAGTRPRRIRSLAVFEPASIPGPLSPAESEAWDDLIAKLKGLEGPAFMDAFIRAQLKAGVQVPPPPPGPPSPEMRKRPAGIATLVTAFSSYEFDRAAFLACDFPTFYAYGDQTHEIEAVRASIVGRLFGDVRIRRFAGVHHFVPAEQIYTAEHAELLLDHWRRADR